LTDIADIIKLDVRRTSPQTAPRWSSDMAPGAATGWRKKWKRARRRPRRRRSSLFPRLLPPQALNPEKCKTSPAVRSNMCACCRLSLTHSVGVRSRTRSKVKVPCAITAGLHQLRRLWSRQRNPLSATWLSMLGEREVRRGCAWWFPGQQNRTDRANSCSLPWCALASANCFRPGFNTAIPICFWSGCFHGWMPSWRNFHGRNHGQSPNRRGDGSSTFERSQPLAPGTMQMGAQVGGLRLCCGSARQNCDSRRLQLLLCKIT